MNLEHMLKVADKLDIKYKLNSETPGLFIVDADGIKQEVTVEDILMINSRLDRG